MGRGQMASRRDDIMERDFVILALLPSVVSILSRFLVLGWQYLTWLRVGVWPEITLHTALNWWAGRPISLNWATSWLLIDLSIEWLPLALWLIVYLPMFWIVIWAVITLQIRH